MNEIFLIKRRKATKTEINLLRNIDFFIDTDATGQIWALKHELYIKKS